MIGLEDLVQACGGLFNHITTTLPACDEPKYVVHAARSGDLSKTWCESSKPYRMRTSKAFLHGGGVGLSDEEALIPALAEGLERYCTTLFDPRQCITASAEDLGEEALDLDTIPRCSDEELSYPDCPLRRPSKRGAIRWVKSVALLSGQVKYVPAVMVYLFLKPICEEERICLPITTGCAAHRTFEQALLGGLLELVERDALSVTWLQRLSLPEITFSESPYRTGPDWDAYLDSSINLECRLYDATGDLGIPTIYGVQRSRTDRNLETVVSCASSLDPATATHKVLKDLVSTRMYLRSFKGETRDYRLLTELPQSAVYMGEASHAGAFDFLWKTNHYRSMYQISPIGATSSMNALQQILVRLNKAKMNAFAIDLSSDEAIRAGMRVVRVLIPELQPFSPNYTARYLGHKRLYVAPRNMGYVEYSESQLNRYPQPFA